LATARDDIELLTVTEVARRLRVHRSTVWRLVQSQRLPAVHVTPRITRIPRRAVEAFVEAASGQPGMVSEPAHPVEEMDPIVRDLRRFREGLLAKRHGQLFSDSTEILRRLREDRAAR
jgi:excisionase family DNA binding protein